MFSQFIASAMIVSVCVPLLSLLPNYVPSTISTPVVNTPSIVVLRSIPIVENKPVKPAKPVIKAVKADIISQEVKTVVKEGLVQESTVRCTSKVRIDLVNHAFKISGGDMKFLGTVASESMFDVGAVGDGGMSIGLCQFHRGYQPDNHKAYKELKTDFEKLEFCYSKYKIWNDKGMVERRLYGSLVWKQGLKKLNISCQ